MNEIDKLRPEVQKAVDRIGLYVDGKLIGEALDTIRAGLLRLEDDNERLRGGKFSERDWHALKSRAEKAEAELAALKAMLTPCARVVGGEVRVHMDQADEGKHVAVLVFEE